MKSPNFESMQMNESEVFAKNWSSIVLWGGLIFLFGYWLFGFDGITFSDDVYYLLAGRDFWEGKMGTNDYHFSSRWGAYIPAGLIVHWFGMNPHWASAISFIAYLITFLLLFRLQSEKEGKLIFSIWMLTQVYLLHFLTKVYPDALLVLCVAFVVFASTFRFQKPFLAALGIIIGFFVGMVTKETMILLGTFPILILYFDWRSKKMNFSFLGYLIALGTAVILLYLSYFWWKFGDPFYRVTSINAGHYVSEFTYGDKGWKSILRRVSYLPITTFVERIYWPWIVFAIPGIWNALKTKKPIDLEFSLAFLSLLIGFWFMSSTLELYNPIYLNPRHLIVIVPILAFLIGSGWKAWKTNPKMKWTIMSLMILGVAISVFQNDWKTAAFQGVLTVLLFLRKSNWQLAAFSLVLISPAISAIQYQKELKDYPHLINELNREILSTENQSPILVNNFIYFSREVLIPDQGLTENKLIPVESADSLIQTAPEEIRVFIYHYYQHAYPQEEEDIVPLESLLEPSYQLQEGRVNGQVEVNVYRKRN